MTPETRSLLRAAAVGDAALVKSLIAEGTDVNCVSAAGQTPLMLAAAFGHEEIVRVLLESGAFIGATDELGLTANEWAARFPKIATLISASNSTSEMDESTGTSDDSNGHQRNIARLAAQRTTEANRQRFEQPESRVTLGGLAGAILRERVAKTSHSIEEHEEGVDVLPPPAPPPRSLVDTPTELDSNEVEPVVDSLIDLEEPSEGAPHRNEPLIGYPVDLEDSLVTAPGPVVDYPFVSEGPVEVTPGRTDAVFDYPFESEEPVEATPGRTDSVFDYPFESEEPVEATPGRTDAVVDYPFESEEPVEATPGRTDAVVDYPFESEEPVEATPGRTDAVVDYPFESEEPVEATPGRTDAVVDYPFEAEEPVEATPGRTDAVVDYPFESEEPVVSSPVRTDATLDEAREWEEPAFTSDPGEPLVDYQLESEDPTPSTSRQGTPIIVYPKGSEAPVESKPLKTQGIIDYPADYDDRPDEFAQSGDDTLSRAGVRASDDTSPSGPDSRQRRESFQSLGLSEGPPARISKVHVDVSPNGRQGSTRTLIWILVILFLGGGAYAGYRLSSYFLNSTNPPEATVNPTAEPPSQPTLGPVKAAPVVGGELAGTELFVPDAEYPTAAAPQSGTVIVHVRVNQKGIVLSADATEGDDKFTGAAEQAGKQAAFAPGKLRGKGQVVGGTITYTFIPPTTTSGTTETATSTPAPEPDAETPRVGGPLAGSEVRVPQPDYPPAARSRNIAGSVTIVVRVSRAGRVVSWRTVDGDSLLRSAALKAAKGATFDPAKLPGTGDVVGTITFTFAP